MHHSPLTCIFLLQVLPIHTFSITDSDFGASASITVNPPGPKACIDFTDLVVNDNVALEGLEAFTILVGNSMAMVTIIDNDGKPDVLF